MGKRGKRGKFASAQILLLIFLLLHQSKPEAEAEIGSGGAIGVRDKGTV
jgi:hypothetical protein